MHTADMDRVKPISNRYSVISNSLEQIINHDL